MMKRTFIPALILILLQNGLFAQQKTSFGDDVSTLDGIMKAYYDVVSVKKGEKVSFERDSLLHVPNALVGLPGKGKDGKFRLKLVTLKEYHIIADPGAEKNGFYEKEISRKVEKFGAIYHVWSTYESRTTSTSPVMDRGINSIELFYDGTRFWISSWSFDSETKENKIPEEYLKN